MATLSNSFVSGATSSARFAGCLCTTRSRHLLWFGSVLMHKLGMVSGVTTETSCSNSVRLNESSAVGVMLRKAIPGLMCEEEEEEDVVPIENEEFESSFHVNGLVPWRDSGFDDFGLGLGGVNEGPAASESVVANQQGVQFLEEMDAEVLSKRVLVLSRRNKVRSALELLRSMELAGLHPNAHACNSLLLSLLRNGLNDDAMRVFRFMKDKTITTQHTYSLMLKAVAHAQGCDSSLRMFMELEEEGNRSKDFDAVVYNTIISICGRMNYWHKCERLWMSMKENGLTATKVTYSELISVFVRCGQYELAIDAYEEMVLNGYKPNADISQAIIKASTKEGKWDLALNIYQNMLSNALEPNLITCNVLINSLGKAGKVELAFKVYSITKSFGHTPDAYTMNALVSALYRANRPGDALRLFDNIMREQASQLNVHLYNNALMSCSKLGLWDRALQLLWKMESSGLSVSTASYNLVINACEVARKPEIALQVYEHMIHKNCTPDMFTHLSLVRSCIWGSLWIEIEEILKASPNASLYNAVIQGMCLRGKIDSAKKTYMRMREKGLKPDGKTRALMLQNLRRVR
ncbi:pentatricopeptide repeat-containing protein At3g29290 [Syzygium oleosum]|uniref:pentatricopeptide repeat-containing protein At3g29290 n=1 Tax=Syzygium oleosum TaxID=219896 RepID=UPI0011D2959C|nr:pentatricopeptide repeat-containing protein At3g29290 [Syzygium oleosum]XP_056176116.1 pentatricopeptide repeat-containing protein At3g29290 [Syzygium oleosum]